MISIEITNAQEVASQQSLLAKLLSKVKPELIRRKVDEKVVEQIREHFQGWGIEAIISIDDH